MDLIKRRPFTKEERLQVYNKYGGKCAYCGQEIEYEDMQVDHLYPLNLGGTNDMDNLMPSCRPCNHYKHTLTLEKFRQALSEEIKVLNKSSVAYRNAKRFNLIQETNMPVTFYFEKCKKE